MIYRTPRSELQQEPDTLPWKTIVAVFVAVVALVVALVIVAGRITTANETALRPSRCFPEKYLAPPRDPSGVEETLFGQRGIGQAMNRLSARELERYRWVDRERGLVTIPIERAMDLVVEEEEAK